jgi:hypothetical protein
LLSREPTPRIVDPALKSEQYFICFWSTSSQNKYWYSFVRIESEMHFLS